MFLSVSNANVDDDSNEIDIEDDFSINGNRQVASRNCLFVTLLFYQIIYTVLICMHTHIAVHYIFYLFHLMTLDNNHIDIKIKMLIKIMFAGFCLNFRFL